MEPLTIWMLGHEATHPRDDHVVLTESQRRVDLVFDRGETQLLEPVRLPGQQRHVTCVNDTGPRHNNSASSIFALTLTGSAFSARAARNISSNRHASMHWGSTSSS